MRFTPPVGGVQVLQGKVYSYYRAGSGATPTLYVYDNQSGKPGTKKFEATYSATHNQWDIIPITTTIYYDSDFWIVVKVPRSTAGFEPAVVSDGTVDYANRNVIKPATGSWTCPAGLYGDLFIRAIVSGTGVEQELYPVEIVTLNQNRPNPVANGTAISYMLSQRARTKLAIYDVTGKLVKSLVNDVQESGMHRVMWDRRDNQGERVHSGVYFYRLNTDTGGAFSRVMTVL